MDSMDYVGLADIFERKEFIIDGKKQIYYKEIDAAYGIKYDFKTEGESFLVLTGKLAGKYIRKGSIYDNLDFKYTDFKTLNKLCAQNNHTYNYDKFMEAYRSSIGAYYTFDSKEKTFFKVKDQQLLQKIKGSTKDYDDTILNNNTDISQMYSTIKKTIIAQDEQIMQILTSLFKNQKVINSSLSTDMVTKLKENIIVYGSTGTGKTEILKRIANIYQGPIVIEDATSLSETGYVGRNISDMLENLYLDAGKDIEKAQKGILVIDEFDKLAEKDISSRDHVSRIGVQRSLLKL